MPSRCPRIAHERPVVSVASGFDGGSMADTQAGDEAARERLTDRPDRRRRVERITSPYAGDSRADDDGRRCGEQGGGAGEGLLAAWRLAEPERRAYPSASSSAIIARSSAADGP